MRATLLIFTLLAGTLACTAVPAAAQKPAHAVALPSPSAPMTKAARALLAFEDERFKAEARGDRQTLDRMTAEDLVYSHLTGMRQDKPGVIAMLQQMHFQSITPSDRYARVIGDVGIVRGKVARQLPDRVLSDGYIAMYIRRQGHWQLLEWASTAPPPA